MKAETIETKQGDMLFHENDRSTGLYLIQEGSIDIFRAREGTELSLATLKAGDVIGTMTLVSGSPRTASARCKEPCKLVFYRNENLKENFKSIPVWAQAVIKDTISRVQDVNEKLMDVVIKEKTLQKHLGTVYHHSSQVAYLLSVVTRQGVVQDETKTPLYPMKHFLDQATFIVFKKRDYLEKIMQVFSKNELFKIGTHQKYGPVIVKPDADLMEDYTNFVLNAVKKGTNYFIPQKFYRWMQACIRISKEHNNVTQFEKTLMADRLRVQLADKEDPNAILSQLIQQELLRDGGTSVTFSPDFLYKKIIFESIIKELKDIKLS